MPGATITLTGATLQPVVAYGLLRTLTDPDASDAQRARAAGTARPLLTLDEGASEVEVTRALATFAEHGPPLPRRITESIFDPLKHPRGRAGKFARALHSLPDGSSIKTPDGVEVKKQGDTYMVRGKHFSSPKLAALEALDISARSKHPKSLGGKQSFAGLTKFEQFEKRHPSFTKNVGHATDEVTANMTANALFALLQSADLEEAPAPVTNSDVPPPPVVAQAPEPKTPTKGRGGKAVTKPGEAKNSDFEGMHPRGRGGMWVKKGDGSPQAPSPQVAHLQKRLQQLGYGPGAADGQFGDVTETSLQRFQSAYGLAPTGKVDPATMATLQNPPAETVAEVQAQNRALATLPNAQGQLPSTGRGTGGSAGGSSGHVGSPAAGPSANAGAATGTVLNTNDPNAVKQFQTQHGLTPDGIIGPKTLTALNGTASMSTSAGAPTKSTSTTRKTSSSSKPLALGTGVTGNASPAVKTLQAALQNLGYDLGDAGVDGRFGPQTKKSIQKLQRKWGLKADGVVGPQTQKLLTRLTKNSTKADQKGKLASADQQAIFAAAIEDHRESDQDRLEEAVNERRAAEVAGDIEGVVRARAREVALRKRIAEAADTALEEFLGRGGHTVSFNPDLHPRDRVGKFRQILNGLKPGQSVNVQGGGKITKTADGFEHKGKSIGFAEAVNRGLGDAVAKVTGHQELGRSGAERMADAARSTPPEKSDAELFPGEKAVQARHAAARAAAKSTAASHSAADYNPPKVETHNGVDIHEDPSGGHYARLDDHTVLTDDNRFGLRKKIDAELARRRRRAEENEVIQVNLYDRLEEAAEAREAAQAGGDINGVVKYRSMEQEVARQMMEGKALSAEARKASATITRKKGDKTEYKFPIPDKGHARAALARLDQSDLSADEKKKVKAKAKSKLKEAELDEVLAEALDLLDESDVVEALGLLCEGSTAFAARQLGRDPGAILFDPAKHPRNREGEFAALLGAIKGQASHATLPSGVHIHERLFHPGYVVHDRYGKKKKVNSADEAVRTALRAHDKGGKLQEAADSMAKASTPEPFSTSKTSNWVARGGGLPAYIQHIAHDLMEKRGKSESQAIQMAIGIVKRWARGGGNVDSNTRAAAAKAVAQWEALKAKNKAKRVSEAEEIAEAALFVLNEWNAPFDPKRHPRGRGGKFVNVLSKMTSTGPHRPLTRGGIRDLAKVEGQHGLTWNVGSEGEVTLSKWVRPTPTQQKENFAGYAAAARKQAAAAGIKFGDAAYRKRVADMVSNDEYQGLRLKGIREALDDMLGIDTDDATGPHYAGPVTSLLGGADNLLPAPPDFTDTDYLRTIPTAELARRIAEAWDDPNPKAMMYLDGMGALYANTQPYLMRSGADFVRGFLSNAGDWKGPMASAVKTELARRIRD